jgi:hypothetical protein
VDDQPTPYRDKGERRPLAEDERRWLTKQGDVEKGPFDRDTLVRAVKAGRLRPTTLVRAEDETDWRPFASIESLNRGATPAVMAEYDERAALMPSAQGHFGLGLVIGFFGGCLGAIIVQVTSTGPQTKKGAWAGFGLQFAVGVVLRVILASR